MTQMKYWAIALIAGLLAWFLLGGSLGVSAGLVVFLLGGLVLTRLFAGPDGETAVAEAMRDAAEVAEAAETALADPRPEDQAEVEDAAVMQAVRSQIEPEPEPEPEPVAESEPEAEPAPTPAPMPEASMETTATNAVEQGAAPAPRPASTLLAGEQELAARKGTWRYAPAPKPEKPEQPKAGAASEGDGGTESELLRIRGIRPPLIPVLEAAGVTKLSQIAALDAEGVARLTEALGIKKKDRIAEQRWVEQAREMIGEEGGQ